MFSVTHFTKLYPCMINDHAGFKKLLGMLDFLNLEGEISGIPANQCKRQNTVSDLTKYINSEERKKQGSQKLGEMK